MRSFLFLAIALTTTVASDAVFDNSQIVDLLKMNVDYKTKMELKALAANHYMSRAQKKQEFEQILNSQPQNVQDAFIQKQYNRQLGYQRKEESLQQRMQWMPPAVSNAMKQATEARNDINLSDMEYWNKMRQIWSQVRGNRWY
ncbi:hypothetical protein QR680_018847 [Steinernema hermaphroditum]|uniref:SXP/RAL-2 family protein Ani s 5-like cation-binding domain-containing protein n=1 Tax=Steinernema hermaphroditum TaxID=289476 RepID=A0AA39HJ67_9BILA|nr:hypothetical protein QR680_018847 [Steinernema hermaphroditum]